MRVFRHAFIAFFHVRKDKDPEQASSLEIMVEMHQKQVAKTIKGSCHSILQYSRGKGFDISLLIINILKLLVIW